MRWLPPDRPSRRDVVLAALWTVVAAGVCLPIALASTPSSYDVRGELLFVAAAQTVPFWLMRRYPSLAWYTAVAVAILLPERYDVLLADPWPWPPLFGITLFIAFANICARTPRRAAAGAWITAAYLFWVYSIPDQRPGWLIALAAIAVLVDVVRMLRRTSRALGRERRLSEDEKARRTILEERARIARDLHDVVAHHMSMVVVQAETAPYRIDGLSPAATDDFAAISRTAREALNEVRGLLGVLRSDEITSDLRPQPGLHDLGELVGTARKAGARVDVVEQGQRRPLRPGVDVGAYRIVQESLANAARHSPGAPIRVAVTYSDDAVELAIVNAAPAGPTQRTGAVGHGLTGMTERATVVGGTLQAEPTPDGGFAVHARLPAGALR
ncbi:sensor histidine kinase [Cryptosporangium phraense]|uniref:histidine kinase n=1 Tax=Cryptosporangium phraense TaxID=2593070 RepID=A0A545AQD7_9ACTN|nr:histidine kinase [Cryptosporangium phraense]TQS43510.1 sensor histidine kinase [Cryptosporangium phraense]